jgi:hypothetical protein
MDSSFAELDRDASDQHRLFRRSPQSSENSLTSPDEVGGDGIHPTALTGIDQFSEQRRKIDFRRRVVELESRYFEDYETPLPPAVRAGFECFMEYHPMIAMPLLGAEPSGAIVATWKKGTECLSVRFVDRYHVDFAVAFNNGHEDVRHWGKSSLALVFDECPEVRRLSSN